MSPILASSDVNYRLSVRKKTGDSRINLAERGLGALIRREPLAKDY